MILRRVDPVQSARDMSHEDKTEERLMMLPSVLLSHGMSYSSPATLFSLLHQRYGPSSTSAMLYLAVAKQVLKTSANQ